MSLFFCLRVRFEVPFFALLLFFLLFSFLNLKECTINVIAHVKYYIELLLIIVIRLKL